MRRPRRARRSKRYVSGATLYVQPPQPSRPRRLHLRSFGLRGLEQTDARLSGSGRAAIARAEQRGQRRVWLSRKSNAWAATRTRRLHPTSCVDPSPRQSMNWSATCGARIVRGVQAQPSDSAAAVERSLLMILHQHGGRSSETEVDCIRSPPSKKRSGANFESRTGTSAKCRPMTGAFQTILRPVVHNVGDEREMN